MGADTQAPKLHPDRSATDRPRLRLLILDVPTLSLRIALCRKPPLLTEIRPGALSARLLQQIDPDCIVFSLFSSVVDSHQLLRTLSTLDYRGHIIAVTPPLPNARMVRAELRSYADGLRLRLFALP